MVAKAERLVAVAIMRDGHVHASDFREHWKLRAALGSEHEQPGDVNGFITSKDRRFVTRGEAKVVALACGQLGAMWQHVAREVLSSDLNWDGGGRDKKHCIAAGYKTYCDLPKCAAGCQHRKPDDDT